MNRHTQNGRVASFLVLLSSLLLGGHAIAAENEVSHCKIEVDKDTREYRLFVPSAARGHAAPMIFAFHGFGIDNMDRMPVYTQLDRLAEREGCILVYPNGLDARWRLRPERNEDIAFFDALLGRLTGELAIDQKRIYATGMSNGAYFANLLAAERSNVIAAIAPHSGGLGLLARRGIHAQRKYAVLVIHGSADEVVPAAQGRQCRDTYVAEEHPVAYVEVPGLRHAWGQPAEINETIWKFFRGHPLTK